MNRRDDTMHVRKGETFTPEPGCSYRRIMLDGGRLDASSRDGEPWEIETVVWRHGGAVDSGERPGGTIRRIVHRKDEHPWPPEAEST